MLYTLIFLLTSARIDPAEGLVEISPSGVAPVCQAGDQLELTCSATGAFLRWEFTVIRESEPAMPFRVMPIVTSNGPSGVPPPVTANSTRFTFSRFSAQDSTPLISMLTINPVSEGLNGVEVKCMDVELPSESVATTIRIVGTGDTPRLNLSVQSHSEEFFSDRVLVTVLLEWTISLSQIYYQQLLRNVSVDIAPDPEVIMTNIENMSVQLTLQYNTLYNVNITQPGICGQPNQTTFIQLNYNKCSNPMELTHNNVQVMGYEDPALEEEIITFTCTSGLEHGGPHSSVCMRNGEWEPDPGEVNCTREKTICGQPHYVLQIRDAITIMSYKEFRNPDFNSSHICCSGILVIEANTKTCLEEELNTTQLKFEGYIVGDRLRTELISVSCVLILAAAMMLIIGFVSGHCFSQRYRKSGDGMTNDDAAKPNLTKEQVDDVELNKNVAYITLRPIAR